MLGTRRRRRKRLLRTPSLGVTTTNLSPPNSCSLDPCHQVALCGGLRAEGNYTMGAAASAEGHNEDKDKFATFEEENSQAKDKTDPDPTPKESL